MQSFAIHLFIDAWPNGWMKAIMDCERRPKPAWFAYREALTPLLANLRTDRWAFFSGEPIEMEAWVCNDQHEAAQGATLLYQIEADGKVLQTGSSPAAVPSLDSAHQGTVRFLAPEVTSRAVATVRLGLFDAEGKPLHDTSVTVKVLPRQQIELRRVYVVGKPDGKAALLARDLGAMAVNDGPVKPSDAILIDDLQAFERVREQVEEAVREGARALFIELPRGTHLLGGAEVVIGANKSTPLHFVSRDTGHPLVVGFDPDDFKFWFDSQLDRPAPLLRAETFVAPGWEPVLLSSVQLVVARKPEGKGHWCICQLALSGRIAGNPVASIFGRRLLAR